MRHRIKKIPTLSKLNHKFNHHLLHSDKSTYFYNNTNGKIGNKLNFLYSSKISTIPLVLSAFGLLLVLGCMVSPLGMSERAYAAVTVPDPKFSIQLSLGNTVQTEQQLDSGVVGYIANNFTVNTTGTASYSIYLQPDTGNGFSNKLIGQKHKQEITGVGSNVGVNNFGRNTWGYGLTDTNAADTANNALTYSTIPDGSTPIKTISNPDDGNDAYKLVFAAKINDDKPADHYQSQAILSVVGSPKNVTLTTLSDITQMQDMTTAICSNSEIGESKTLIDSRDSSSYSVKKLSDGKCWMAQGLRIANKMITPTDSDVTYSYAIPASSSAWSDTAPETNKVFYWDSLAINYGNYYTWYTATAGTGNNSITTNGKNAPSSICPKGWRLPTGGNSGDLQTLINKGRSTWTSNSIANGYWLGGTSATTSGAAFFTATGLIHSGGYYGDGEGGYYWSSTAYDATTVYMMGFTPTSIAGTYNANRYFGYVVRCVAR